MFWDRVADIIIEEHAANIANYIIENNVTIRHTAKRFEISKFTVHISSNKMKRFVCGEIKG